MISILGSALGFATSVIPEVIGIVKQHQKDKQELRLLEARAKYAERLSELKLNELDVQADIAETKGIHEMQTAANANSKFAATLSGSVRPIIAYAFMLLFLAVKGLAASQVYSSDLMDWEVMMSVVWDTESQVLWSAIISFYFGHRAMQKIRTR